MEIGKKDQGKKEVEKREKGSACVGKRVEKGTKGAGKKGGSLNWTDLPWWIRRNV